MTLHELVQSARSTIRFFLLSIPITLLILLLILQTIRFLQGLNPPPPPPPSVGFGKLPKLSLGIYNFPEQRFPSFKLETATGALPALAREFKVYKVKKPTPTLLAAENARRLARAFGFSGSGNLIDQENLRFIDGKRTFTISTVTQNFLLETDISYLAETTKAGFAVDEPEAIASAKGVLVQNGLLKGGFEKGTQKAHIYKIEGGQPKSVEGSSQGDFTAVYFLRSLDAQPQNIPILPQKPKLGAIEVWVSRGGAFGTFQPKISYLVWEYEKENPETYPLKPLALAWEEVKSGAGVVEILPEGAQPLDAFGIPEILAVKIETIEITYVDLPFISDFLQPVYVFSGETQTREGGKTTFVAMIQAVAEYCTATEPQEVGDPCSGE